MDMLVTFLLIAYGLLLAFATYFTIAMVLGMARAASRPTDHGETRR